MFSFGGVRRFSTIWIRPGIAVAVAVIIKMATLLLFAVMVLVVVPTRRLRWPGVVVFKRPAPVAASGILLPFLDGLVEAVRGHEQLLPVQPAAYAYFVSEGRVVQGKQCLAVDAVVKEPLRVLAELHAS